MIIVKKKGEIIRFGLFLALVGAMAYYVATRAQTWATSQAPAPRQSVTAGAKAGASIGAPAQTAGVPMFDNEGQDFFNEYRIERDRSRGALRETLREVMESQTADADQKKQASQQFMDLGRVAMLETKAEANVKAMGFGDVVVDIVDQSARVVVKAATISKEQFVRVTETVGQVTGIKPVSITVIYREQ